jgi:hypothetical protein
MATERIIFADAFPANGDQSANQFKFVTLSGGKIQLPALGAKVAGVLVDDPKANQSGTVAMMGYAKVKCVGVVAELADVATDAAGLAKVAAAGEYVVARAMEAGVANQIIRVLLIPSGAKA